MSLRAKKRTATHHAVLPKAFSPSELAQVTRMTLQCPPRGGGGYSRGAAADICSRGRAIHNYFSRRGGRGILNTKDPDWRYPHLRNIILSKRARWQEEAIFAIKPFKLSSQYV
jgi:hypothetical protein